MGIDLTKNFNYFLVFTFFLILNFNSKFIYSKNNIQNIDFTCKGNYKTFINDYPIEIKIKNEKTSWKVDIPNEIEFQSFIEKLDQDISLEDVKDILIGPSIITLFYSERENIELNVKYSDGVFVDRIDKNKLLIKWLWIEGTLIQDICVLEMPIEIDSFEKFIDLYPF